MVNDKYEAAILVTVAFLVDTSPWFLVVSCHHLTV